MKTKTVNLTSRVQMPSAEAELVVPYTSGEIPLGQRVGGMEAYSNVFKRGYGNNVFGSDSNGIWLGAADYADAPFRVSMDGAIRATSDDGTNSSLINSQGIILYKNDIPQVVIATI